MNTKLKRIQEIVNRGLVSKLPPKRQAIVKEMIRRGMVKVPEGDTSQPATAQPATQVAQQDSTQDIPQSEPVPQDVGPGAADMSTAQARFKSSDLVDTARAPSEAVIGSFTQGMGEVNQALEPVMRPVKQAAGIIPSLAMGAAKLPIGAAQFVSELFGNKEFSQDLGRNYKELQQKLQSVKTQLGADIDPILEDAATNLGEIGAGFAVPGGVAGSLGRRIGTGAASGLATGVTRFKEEGSDIGSRLEEGAVEAIVGGAVPFAVTMLGQAGKVAAAPFLSSSTKQAREVINKTSDEALDQDVLGMSQAIDAAKRIGVKLSPGEAAGTQNRLAFEEGIVGQDVASQIGVEITKRANIIGERIKGLPDLLDHRAYDEIQASSKAIFEGLSERSKQISNEQIIQAFQSKLPKQLQKRFRKTEAADLFGKIQELQKSFPKSKAFLRSDLTNLAEEYFPGYQAGRKLWKKSSTLQKIKDQIAKSPDSNDPDFIKGFYSSSLSTPKKRAELVKALEFGAENPEVRQRVADLATILGRLQKSRLGSTVAKSSVSQGADLSLVGRAIDRTLTRPTLHQMADVLANDQAGVVLKRIKQLKSTTAIMRELSKLGTSSINQYLEPTQDEAQ